MTTLHGKRVLIAGGGGGIGGAIALAAAGQGAKVMIFGRHPSPLKATRDQAQKVYGAEIAVFTGDATNEADARAAIADCVQRFGGVDIAVNAVGSNIKQRKLTELTGASWSSLIDTNLGAAYNLTQAVLPTFRSQSDGLLIHISSVAATRADGSGAGYQASKAAVAALARATMFEERHNGVRVSVVLPGFTDTAFADSRPIPPTQEELEQALQPEDVAHLCLTIMALPARAHLAEVTLAPSTL